MAQKSYCLVSGILFVLIAVAHLLRILSDTAVQVDGIAIPILVSWVAVIVPTALAVWAFSLIRSVG